jgi:hypothetical protein
MKLTAQQTCDLRATKDVQVPGGMRAASAYEKKNNSDAANQHV